MKVVLGAAALAGCATQPAYVRPPLALADRWDNGGAAATGAVVQDTLARENWWSGLHDTAVDALVSAALIDNPTLAEAVARVDEARATVGADKGALYPQLNASGSAAGSQVGGTGSSASTESSATIGPSLSWELDLWGRLRETVRASADRLDARTADAESARLSLSAEIADDALDYRACRYSLSVRDSDIASRETELRLTRLKLLTGAAAPVDVSSSESDLETARTSRISQAETCEKDVDALAALTGKGGREVRAFFPAAQAGPTTPTPTTVPPEQAPLTAIMPTAPASEPALPAVVLLGHPDVRSAERELAAAWSNIAVARAERLPTLNLTAALAGNWVKALGSTTSYLTDSLGPSFSAPLLDGGTGAANVRNAQATYREDLAALRLALRTAAQNVEDALASRASADGRMESSARAVVAARATLVANEARRRAGSISQFELEDSRRSYTTAQESQITAARDGAEAWVNLVKATGGAFTQPSVISQAAPSPPDPGVAASLHPLSPAYVQTSSR